jgi:hypothetical protein
VVALAADGNVLQTEDWGLDFCRTDPPQSRPVKLIAAPYSLWCSRGANRMQPRIAKE